MEKECIRLPRLGVIGETGRVAGRLGCMDEFFIGDTRAGIMRKYSGNYAKINASFVEKQSERKPEDVDRREGRGAHMRVATQCKNTR